MPPLAELVIEIALFLVLTGIGIYIVKKMTRSSNIFLKATTYLPKDEIQTLKQVKYLILMAACFINVMYPLIFINSDVLFFTIFDLILSLYIAITIDKSTTRRKLMLLLLVPYGSLTYLLFQNTLLGLLDLIHVPVCMYLVKYYYDEFKEYTESQGLGVTVLLLFTIIFVSFIITSLVENKDPLDSLIMVSNAFTSNGYAVLGSSPGGKLNSLILVWSGFIISGVGTATLASAILTRHLNSKLKNYDEKIEELNGKIDETNDKLDNLERLIRNNHDD